MSLLILILITISLQALFMYFWFKWNTIHGEFERIFWIVVLFLIFMPFYLTISAVFIGLESHKLSQRAIIETPMFFFFFSILFILPTLISLEVLVSNIKNFKFSNVFDKLAGLSAIPSVLLFFFTGFNISSLLFPSPSRTPGSEPAMTMVGGLIVLIPFLGGVIFSLPMLILMLISRLWRKSVVWSKRLSILLVLEITLFIFLKIWDLIA